MSPPELSGNTPVSDIVCPVKVCLFHTLRNQLDLSLFDSFYCRFDQLVHLNEPLLFDHWLYRCLTTVVCTNIVAIIFNTDK